MKAKKEQYQPTADEQAKGWRKKLNRWKRQMLDDVRENPNHWDDWDEIAYSIADAEKLLRIFDKVRDRLDEDEAQELIYMVENATDHFALSMDKTEGDKAA